MKSLLPIPLDEHPADPACDIIACLDNFIMRLDCEGVRKIFIMPYIMENKANVFKRKSPKSTLQVFMINPMSAGLYTVL